MMGRKSSPQNPISRDTDGKETESESPVNQKWAGELDFGKPHPVFSKMATEELKTVDLDALGPQEGEHWKVELQRRNEQLDHTLLGHLDVGGSLALILKAPSVRWPRGSQQGCIRELGDFIQTACPKRLDGGEQVAAGCVWP